MAFKTLIDIDTTNGEYCGGPLLINEQHFLRDKSSTDSLVVLYNAS